MSLLKWKNNNFVFPLFSCLFNIIYAFYQEIIGYNYHSLWFITMFFYNLLLSFMKGIALYNEYKKKKNIYKLESFFFFMLAIWLAFMLYFSLKYDLAKQYHPIIMITLATYTFYKIISSIINYFKTKKATSFIKIIRNINCIEAMVSLLSMQMSMYVTFSSNRQSGYIMEVLTGCVICLIIMLLSLSMYKKSKIDEMTEE